MTARHGQCIALVLTFAWMTPGLYAQESLTATVALAKLKAGNARFAGDKLKLREVGTEKRQELVKGQKPFAIILTCADSRVAPEYIFDQGLGEVVVLRVEGNISEPGVLGSIEYSLEHLHCPLIVVMGHDKCGAVQAALEPGRPEGNLGWLIKQIEPGKDLPKDPKEALPLAVKNNAVRQAQLLTEKSTVIKEFAQSRRVQIVPAVYALASGKVEWLDTPKLTGKHPVTIRVIVPTADTRLWLDGIETKSRGKTRVFEVPPVDAEREFNYEIRIEWDEPGAKGFRDVRTVRFKGGATVTEDFTVKAKLP